MNQAIKRVNASVKNKTIKLEFKVKNVKFKNIKINNRIYINWSRIFVLFISIFGFVILIKYRKKMLNKLEKTFLFISILSGMLFLLVTPKCVYTAWDDQIHLKNSYSLFSSQVSRFSSALKIVDSDSSLKEDIFQTQEERINLYKYLNKKHINTKNEKFQFNDSTKLYTKFIYLPYYIGFKIALLLNFNYILTFLFAKIVSLAFYILLMYIAIKISTSAKKVIFLISLFASNIFIATQFSYDASIIPCIILALSLFMRQLELEKINNKYLIGFVLCIVWASLPKAIYAPLLLLFLFIPNNKFKTKKQALYAKAIVVLITLLLISTFILPILLKSATSDARGGNTSIGGQIRFILSNPFNFMIIMCKYFIMNAERLFIGTATFVNLAYLTHYVDDFISLIYTVNLFLLLYVLFTGNYSKKILNTKMRIIFMIAYIGIYLLITLAMYLSFTPVGNSTIEGVQTRYFIPMLPLLLFIISPASNKVKKDNSSNILLILIPYCILMLISILFVFKGVGI